MSRTGVGWRGQWVRVKAEGPVRRPCYNPEKWQWWQMAESVQILKVGPAWWADRSRVGLALRRGQGFCPEQEEGNCHLPRWGNQRRYRFGKGMGIMSSILKMLSLRHLLDMQLSRLEINIWESSSNPETGLRLSKGRGEGQGIWRPSPAVL